jgi:multidrug efflux pump
VTASVRGPLSRGGGGGGGGNGVELIVTGVSTTPSSRAGSRRSWRRRGKTPAGRPRIDYEPNAPRLLVDIDREKAAALGVSTTDIGRALETMFGSRRATTYVRGGQEYDVLLQTELEQRRASLISTPSTSRGGAGELVPLSSVVTTELRGDTPDRRRLDRLRAIT